MGRREKKGGSAIIASISGPSLMFKRLGQDGSSFSIHLSLSASVVLYMPAAWYL